MAIKDYSTTPDMNTSISGINIAEGCAPSGINNAIRQLMADVKMEKDARDAAQSTKDAEQEERDAQQDAAISAAQSSADAAKSAADEARETMAWQCDSTTVTLRKAGGANAERVALVIDTADGQRKIVPVVDNRGIVFGENTPVGEVLFFAGSSIPTGFLLCNGATVSRTTYAALFSAIGTTYGAGDGSSTFVLPNLIDKFIQGSGKAGTSKAAGLPNITGTTKFGGANSEFTGEGAFFNSVKGAAFAVSGNSTSWKASFNASKSNSIYGASSTVQPPALTLLPGIKY